MYTPLPTEKRTAQQVEYLLDEFNTFYNVAWICYKNALQAEHALTDDEISLLQQRWLDRDRDRRERQPRFPDAFWERWHASDRDSETPTT